MTPAQTTLFATADPVRTQFHGHRVTPPELVTMLCRLPEWNARAGVTLDLGCGEGGLCREIERLQPGQTWHLLDIRREALRPLWTWNTGRVTLHGFDAAVAGWAGHWDTVWRVVSNPPWSVNRCASGHQWPAKGRPYCPKCGDLGHDLAILMVGQAMRECVNADIWVLHNQDWPFHPRRARFFGGDALPETHVYAGHDTLSGQRVAFSDPAERGKVQPYNKPAVWWHFVPRHLFTEQHSRFHVTAEEP